MTNGRPSSTRLSKMSDIELIKVLAVAEKRWIKNYSKYAKTLRYAERLTRELNILRGK